MSDADFDHELARIFAGFAAAILLLVIYYCSRLFRVRIFGQRHRGRVVRVIRESSPEETKSRPAYRYEVRYADASGREVEMRDPGGLPFREFREGQEVSVYVQRWKRNTGEIVSGLRLGLSFGMILLVAAGLSTGYYWLLGRKTRESTAPVTTATQFIPHLSVKFVVKM